MFTVKTVLRPSQIEGNGVFAGEFIPKGTVVWKFNPLLDRVFERSFVERAAEPERSFLQRYAYLNQRTGKFVLCVDDSRFVNHSDHPNLDGYYPPGDDEGLDIAIRDIEKGEELTSDYRTFDKDCDRKLRAAVLVG